MSPTFLPHYNPFTEPCHTVTLSPPHPIETVAQVNAFRARHAAASTKNASLVSSTPTIDLARYKSILKDQSALQNAEKVLSSFKPVSYDLGKITGVVDAFESRAVDAAKKTLEKIQGEQEGLEQTLSNIREARPFEDLTVREVSEAQPQITKAVETMVKKGKWSVPGYRVSLAARGCGRRGRSPGC